MDKRFFIRELEILNTEILNFKHSKTFHNNNNLHGITYDCMPVIIESVIHAYNTRWHGRYTKKVNSLL